MRAKTETRMTPQHQRIIDALFKAVAEAESLYAILDSARTIDIAFQLQNIQGVEYVSLYKGRKEELMWDAAPYLTRCERDSEFFNWVIEQGWGNSWGIFLTSASSLDDLCKHFRQFLLVQDENGKQMYFRFYDPRVLRLYLPTCNAEETKQFFGPVNCYLMEASQPDTLLKFAASPQGVKQQAVFLQIPKQEATEGSAS